MKILVVGYACDPYRGSEPGVGWTAVCRIARRHEVYVLTDDHNRRGWERGQAEGIIPPDVHVRFLRKERPFLENRFLAHIQSWMFYSSFNRQVLAAAQAWHREESFDLCHQVTIAAWRMPSPLWQLPIPFVWGPIGGAGYIPKPFRTMLSRSARYFEVARDLQTIMASRSRAFRSCISESAVVFAANEETESFLRPFRRGKPLIRLAIASIPSEKVERFRRPSSMRLNPASTEPGIHALHAADSEPDAPLRLFAGGNMEGRKGVSLALRSLALVLSAGYDFHYTVAGGGPEIPSLKTLATQLGLGRHVTFHAGFSGDDYVRQLWQTDVYFLPSFRESTPVTLLEAYLAGCYPVVAATSAQGEIVKLMGGRAVPIADIDSLVCGLADAIIWCARHRQELAGLAKKASDQLVRHLSSEKYDTTVEQAYRTATTSRSRGSYCI